MTDLRRFRARAWRRVTAEDEAGMAMIIAMCVMVILILLTTVVFNQAVSQLPLARHDQDHESALHAAESGVDDYINHINANNNYFIYSASNPDSPVNGAFVGWVPLPGGTAIPTNESFRYSVNNTATAGTGVVYLTASGCAAPTLAACSKPGAVIRTVKVGLRKVGFLDFVYFTDYEIVDPAISGLPLASCNFRAWEFNASTLGYGPDLANCDEIIEFHTGDVLNGPVHSNDAFHMCGTPSFPVSIDSGWDQAVNLSQPGISLFVGPGGVVQDVSGGCGAGPATGALGVPLGPPTNRWPTGTSAPFPTTNLALATSADVSKGGSGCLYYGATSINLHMQAGLPVMDVTNTPGTTAPALAPTGPAGFNCGPGVNLPLPVSQPTPGFNGVIYVNDVPAAYQKAPYCTVGTTCVGNLAIHGTLGGQMTVAAFNNVTITGNLLYNGPAGCNAATACQMNGTDVLGVVGGNDIVIQHPNNCSPNNRPNCLPNLTIDAALLSVQHSIYVENWATGSAMGLLTVNGTLAQKYRGAVGTTGGTGYTKAYGWDPRLRYLSPPYFLTPSQSSWEHISFAELLPTATP